jgi:hypothetical protein
MSISRGLTHDLPVQGFIFRVKELRKTLKKKDGEIKLLKNSRRKTEIRLM